MPRKRNTANKTNNKSKGSAKDKKFGLKIQGVDMQWKREAKKPRGRVNTQTGVARAVNSNAPQVNYTNPNRFWSICRASTPGGLCIRARESIGNLTTESGLTGEFAKLSINNQGYFAVNPNNQSLLRLSSLASIYEYYIFKRCRFEYISTLPQTTAGQIYMTADYTNGGDVPTSASQAMDQISSVMAPVYSNCAMTVQKDLARVNRFICDVEPGTSEDQRDQAAVFAFVSGLTASIGADVGFLMVDYEIEFFTPSAKLGGTQLALKKYRASRAIALAHLKNDGGTDCLIDPEVKNLCNIILHGETFPGSGVGSDGIFPVRDKSKTPLDNYHPKPQYGSTFGPSGEMITQYVRPPLSNGQKECLGAKMVVDSDGVSRRKSAEYAYGSK